MGHGTLPPFELQSCCCYSVKSSMTKKPFFAALWSSFSLFLFPSRLQFSEDSKGPSDKLTILNPMYICNRIQVSKIMPGLLQLFWLYCWGGCLFKMFIHPRFNFLAEERSNSPLVCPAVRVLPQYCLQKKRHHIMMLVILRCGCSILAIINAILLPSK